LETAPGGSPAHPINESTAGYSLAGCSPAEPHSASPAEARISQNLALGITENSKQQVRQEKLSQLRGPPQGQLFAHIIRFASIFGILGGFSAASLART